MKRFIGEVKGRIESVKTRIDQMSAEVKANAERQRQAVVEERERQKAEDIQRAIDRKQKLSEFSGRLVLVTNPGPEATNKHDEIANAIHRALPEGTVLGLSVHMQRNRALRGGYSDMFHVAYALEDRLTKQGRYIHNHETNPDLVGRYVSEQYFDIEKLNEALYATERQTEAMEEPRNIGHVAIVSALGIENVDLDYGDARYGDTFLLTGLNDSGKLQWQKIYETWHPQQ